MNSYKGITFAKGYNKSFADFKEEFGSTHIFNEMHPEEREKELKKAFKIASTDGKLPTTTEKGEESSTK